ncbi:VPA1269 family protein, partial [Vibrio breoganii]
QIMAKKSKKRDGRASDLTFSWMLTTLGTEWQQWQELAAEWMSTQTTGIGQRQKTIARFFESYLAECAPYAISNIDLFFKGYQGHKCSSEELEKLVRKTQNNPVNIQKGVNFPCDFIDFVIEKVFSEEDDNGYLVPL